MSEDLELNCWIFGQEAESVFPVSVSANDKVNVLKDRIKEKNSPAFDSVPTHLFKIWKVNVAIPVDDDNLSDIVKDNEVISKGRSMRSTTRLSTLFPTSPADENLHIVIQVPDYPGKRLHEGSLPTPLTTTHSVFSRYGQTS